MRWTVAVLMLVIASSAASAGVPSTTQPSPRYRLAIGQELTYEGRTAVEFGGSSWVSGTTTVFRVVDRTADGTGWHLIGVASRQGAWSQVVVLDLWPDGRSGADGIPADVAAIFPPLPSAAAERWDGLRDDFLGPETYRRAPATQPAQFAYTAEQSSKTTMANGTAFTLSQTRRGTFNLDAGRVVHAERRADKGMGKAHTTETEVVDLTGTATRSAADTARFAAEAKEYLSAATAYGTATIAARQASDQPAAMACATEPLFALQRSGHIADHMLCGVLDADLANARDAIAKAVGILNRPAPPFDLPDLTGRRHTLAQQRGKVVLLDFWFRGCPPCLEAMPDLQKLAARYVDRPVTLFGMNVDRDAHDAQAVVDRFSLTYPTLRLADGGAEVLRAYLVAGCPTLVVVDRDGVVRHVHVGYAPSTGDDVANEIDQLLRDR